MKIEKIFDEKQIKRRVRELAQEIARDFQGEELLLIGVLKGSFVFLADLIRHLPTPVNLGFVQVSSYPSGQQRAGESALLYETDDIVTGKSVILVEDIVDTGITVRFLLDHLLEKEPRHLKVCTFLNKPSRRKVDISVHYIGFEVPDQFIVGYGLDLDQEYRNLPYLALVHE